jgi:dsDNA-specific endonuclease/ATPase MutS2
MGEDQGTGSAVVTDASDPEQIQREIEQTREELGDTVEALARKADVKAHARQKVEETKASFSETKEQLLGKVKETSPDDAASAASQLSKKARENPMPVAAAGAFAAGFLAGRLTKH